MKGSLAFLAALTVAGLLVGAPVSWAQGFGVYEQGACMTGRGGAGVASPCSDASGIFFNPAGLSFTSTELGLGGTMIGPRGDFTDSITNQVTALNKNWYPVPNIYFSKPIGGRLAVGIGVFAPYGLTTDWPEGSEGRFLGYKSVVQGVYVQPTVAYKVNDNVSIGGGIDVTYLNVELRQRVDLAEQTLLVHPLLGRLTFAQLNAVCPAAVCGSVPHGTDFGNIDLKGHTYGVGGHLGILAKVNERLSLGGRWMIGQRIELDNAKAHTTQIMVGSGIKVPLPSTTGSVIVPADLVLAGQFAPGGKLATDQTVSTAIPLPDQVVVGAAIQATSALKLLVDYQFTRWSMFDKLEIVGPSTGLGTTGVIESYRNTNGVRVGAEANVSKRAILRAGLDVHGAAAPDQTVTPNLPEGSRQEFTAGIGLNVSPGARIDFGYMYMRQGDRAGRTTTGGHTYPDPVPASVNNGTYAFKANIFNATLALRF